MTQIGVGILGFGTVGAGVAAGLIENHDALAERTGADIVLRKIADIDITTDRGVTVPADVLTTDAMSVIQDPSVQVIVELIGGTGIAKTFVCEALKAGKSVVTANKKLLAEYGAEIFGLAAENKVDIYYGASVGGGIPIIRALRDGLAGNKVDSMYGILNGTCNYILSTMEKEGLPFNRVLADAQKLGFAEADPTLDVDGFDTLHKASILAALAYGISPDVHSLPVEGIRNVVEATDIQFAKELGYKIKLLAIVKRDDAGIEIRVAPTLVAQESMLGSVSGVFNAALVNCDMADQTLYYGRGAGRLPTASTVIGDIADIARGRVSGAGARIAMPKAVGETHIKTQSEVRSCFYIRLVLSDDAGSLAKATSIFATHGISISAAIQKDHSNTDIENAKTVVILTHEVGQADMEAALAEIAALDCSHGKPSRLGLLN